MLNPSAPAHLRPVPALRVAVIPERYGNTFSPCASIRLFPFLDRLRLRGDADVRFVLESEVEAFRPHVVIWHRVSLPEPVQIDHLTRVARTIGAKTIFDLDDNLLELDGHGERDAYAGMVSAVRASLACADEVWCSTPALAQAVAAETAGAIHVMPNALDPELWGLDAAPPNQTSADPALRLLYMGTRTHQEDYEFLATVMASLHEKYPGSVELYLVGVRTEDSAPEPWLRTWSPPPYIGASYPAFVRWLSRQGGLDMGVAPLMRNRFNDCKSHIKVLDYAAMGLPTLASAMPAYQYALVDGETCFHAENTTDAWQQKLEALINQPDARDTVRTGARRLIGDGPFDAAVTARWLRLQALAGA